MTYVNLNRLFEIWHKALPLIQAILVFAILFFATNFFLVILRRRLLNRAKTKRQAKAIKRFFRVLRYIILGFLVILAISIASDSLEQFGLTVGIFSAAIGFALQKPITGIAAWIMVMVKRPFEVGDRISMGEVKGNVKDISFTHIYLEEVGRYGGEEVSGRTIIIPNSKLFEVDIINYSFDHEYLLGQVIFTITYESNVEEATAIALSVAKKYTDVYNTLLKKEVHVRLYFSSNGMEIHPRYYVPIDQAQEIASKITKDVYSAFKHHRDIELSYQQYNVQQYNMEAKPPKRHK